jgi:hypothetical protein
VIDGLEIDVGPVAVWLRSRAPLSVLISLIRLAKRRMRSKGLSLHFARYRTGEPPRLCT